MDILDSYKRAMNMYATFDGRTGRKDFWLYVLTVFLITAVAAVLDSVVLMGGALAAIVNLIHFIPSLAAASRRLHDTGKSAWWLLLMFIPLVGFIVLLVFYCTKSDAGANEYGANPA